MSAFCDKMIAHAKRLCKESYDLEEKGDFSKGIWYPAHFYRLEQHLGKKNGLPKETFFHGLIPDVMMSVKDAKSPTGIRPFTYELQPAIAPSVALQKIEQGLCFLDCNQVSFLSFYLALQQELGQERFDALFGEKERFTLTAHQNSYLAKLLPAVAIAEQKQIKRGDICYFSNIQLYVAKHPAGESRGQHMICSQQDPHRYFGFGLPEEIDEARMDYELLDCYNKEPLDEGFLTKELWDYLYSHYFSGDVEKGRKYVASFKEKVMTEEEFSKIPSRLTAMKLPARGRLALWVYRPNIELIKNLCRL